MNNTQLKQQNSTPPLITITTIIIMKMELTSSEDR